MKKINSLFVSNFSEKIYSRTIINAGIVAKIKKLKNPNNLFLIFFFKA